MTTDKTETLLEDRAEHNRIVQERVVVHMLEKIEAEQHPFILDVIDRLIWLYTKAGDIILSPFAGIGSEGYCAVKTGRRFIGVELKRSYFEAACANLRKAEDEARDLFSLKGDVNA